MKTEMINEILLRRRNKVLCKNVSEQQDNIERAIIIQKNLEELGYLMDKDLFNKVSCLCVEDQNKFYKELVGCLKEYVGANKTYNFMYPNFPEQVVKAEDWELFINAVVHYISFGELVPDYEKDERLPLFESTKLKMLSVGTEEDLNEIMNNLVGAKTSLSQQDKDDLTSLLIENNIKEMPEISFKENLPVVARIVLDNTSNTQWFDLLKASFKTSTDVLRLCVGLSDGDISLATHTKFKSMPRSLRKLVIRLLDNCNNIEEDMLRYKGMWLRLGEKLHVGEDTYKAYSKVQTAFDKLRNDVKSIETFGGKVESAIADEDYRRAINLLSTRPGELARALDRMLRISDNKRLVITKFKEVANKISVPVLLQVKEHFDHRCESNDSRVFFPKGQLAKAYTIKNELDDISIDWCDDISAICENAIVEQFKEKESLGKVYISDALKSFAIPQSQRSANSAMKNITRCSRFKINQDAKFIRFGIHWCNELINGYEKRVDIDLSCSFLDENFGNVDHISYTHLRNSYAVHSGDLTNAPRKSGGAAECIDLYFDKVPKNIRYAAVQVYGYTQTKFCNLDDMLFNWQEGRDENVGDIFDPKRVQQNMNLGGDTDCEIPIVIDIKTKEIIWCDLALTTKTNFPRCVEGNIRGLSATVMGVVQSHKPMMYDLAMMNAAARGEIVKNRDDADVIFDLDESKPIITVEKIVEVQNEKGEVLETKTVTETKEKDCKIITPFMVDVWQSDLL